MATRRSKQQGGAAAATVAAPPAAAAPPPQAPAAPVTAATPPQQPPLPASQTSSSDVYEFREDLEEERPRLILTIKSPPEPPTPPTTRKSRRLQEKDGCRNTVDDVIDDVVRSTRSSRRATRSSTAAALVVPPPETTRKSPRRKQGSGGGSGGQVAASVTQPSTAEPAPTEQVVVKEEMPEREATPPPSATTPAANIPATPRRPPSPIAVAVSQQPPPPPVTICKEPDEANAAKPEPPRQRSPSPRLPEPPPAHRQPQQPLPPVSAGGIVTSLPPPLPAVPVKPPEPTTLIDPVTGLLIPMRESEEGQYIPVHSDLNRADGEPPEKKQRVLQGVVEMTPRPPGVVRPSVVRPPIPAVITKTTVPLNPVPPQPQHSPSVVPKVVNLPLESGVKESMLGVARGATLVGPSAPRPPANPMTPKAHILQAVAASAVRPKAAQPQLPAVKAPTPMTPKAHILQSFGNAPPRDTLTGSPSPHQGSLLIASVASPPLRAHQQPIVSSASNSRLVSKGSESRMGAEGGCIVVPSAQPRSQVMQAGLPVPAYEASLGEVVQHVNYPPHHIQPAHYMHHPQMMYQQYLREATIGPAYHRTPGGGSVKASVAEVEEVRAEALELRRGSPQDRTTDSPQVATLYVHHGRPHIYSHPPPPPAHRPTTQPRLQVATPPHASQVPPQADSLLMLLQRYPVMWQGLLALKNDQAAVQMHFVFGNPHVARDSLPCNSDGSTPPLRIAQRMRLEQTQVEGVARKMQMDNEHCMLLALPCGRDHMDVLQQSNNLQSGFITYLQQKQAAGIVNIAAPGSQQAAYVVHIFPACEFANESLARIAPDLLHRVADIAHLLIVIATV